MRTLKKTLCLVMALVMMLGLCAVNVTAASYTDDSSIGADYREAIEVLSTIGVFNGKDDGSLGPQDSLTRVQGCYLICKMLGAPNGAGFTSFSDVSAQDSPVVAYCQTLGIVDGFGDNTFHPYDPLSGAAFAKWCLVALGYNAAVEGMTGVGWMTGTQHLTTVVGLDKDIAGYKQADNITREQAAQMCLNTLQATMVEYQGRIDITNTDGMNVNVAGRRNYLVNQSREDYRTRPSTTEYMEFVEMYFPQLKMDNQSREADEDNMNIPLEHIWNYRGNETFRTLATPVFSYTGKTNKTAVSADMSGYYVVGSDNAKRYITNAATYQNLDTTKPATDGTFVYLNGVQGDLSVTNGGASATILGTAHQLRFDATGKTMAEIISDLTANGREVDFYAIDDDNPNRITHIVVTCYTVARISNITTSGNTTSYTFNSVTGGNVNYGTRRTYSDAPADDTLITDANLAKDDYVTVTYPGNGSPIGASKVYVFATEMFTGVQTSRSSSNTVIIDGTTYNIAAGVAKESTYTNLLSTTGATPDFANSNTTSNFFMDQFGYLVHSDAVANGNYAFIVGATGKSEANVDGHEPEISVRAVLSDGTVGTYKVATEKKKINTLGTIYYPASGGSSYTTGDAATVIDPQTGEDTASEVYVIKNTKILVGSTDVIAKVGDVTWSNVADNDGSANTAAKILMSTAYGYVYNYTLNAAGDTITLTPVNNTNASAGYLDDNALTEGTVYTGETLGKIVKGTASYASYDPGSSLFNRLLVPAGHDNGTATSHRLLVNADTAIVTYNSNTKTASVITGLTNMPSVPDNSNSAYYAAAANASTTTASLTARALFITRGGGVVSNTKDYYFINAMEYDAVHDDVTGSDYFSYRAWLGDDSHFVKDVDDEYIGGDVNHGSHTYSGLYTLNANDEISGKALNMGESHEPRDTEPYAYISKIDISNNMLRVGDGDYYLDGAIFVYPSSITDYNTEGASAYVVLEVENNVLTGYVQYIYVI